LSSRRKPEITQGQTYFSYVKTKSFLTKNAVYFQIKNRGSLQELTGDIGVNAECWVNAKFVVLILAVTVLNTKQKWVNSGFLCEVDKNCALLGDYAVCSGKSVPTLSGRPVGAIFSGQRSKIFYP
jgi:hypothetical protein